MMNEEPNHQVQLDEDYSHLWRDIEEKIQRILEFDYDRAGINEPQGSKCSAISLNDYMSVYSKIYRFCSEPGEFRLGKGVSFVGRDVFDRLKECLNCHLQRVLERIQEGSPTNFGLLKLYHREWQTYLIAARFIDHLFNYLNRHWIPRMISMGEQNIYYIYVLALICWRNVIFDSLRDNLNQALLELVQKDRLGEEVDSKLLRNIILSYGKRGGVREIVIGILTWKFKVDLGLDETDRNKTSLDLYQTKFEGALLRKTMEFYQEESRKFLMHHSMIGYLSWVEYIFNEEQKRIDNYLHDSTRSKVRDGFGIRQKSALIQFTN
jgi:cullin 1